MRSFGFALAAAAALSLCAPASAATMVTTSFSCHSSEPCNSDTALLSFDSSLGTLTGISLKIDAQAMIGYTFYAVDDGPYGAHLTIDAPFDAMVNGLTYTFAVVGAADFIGGGGFMPSFVASGSGTFVLDPALFASFTDRADTCSWVATGICARGGLREPAPVSITAQNATLRRIDHAYYGTYSLTYTYTPFGAVPEPATWAMMLLGFAAIGWRCAANNRAPA